MSEPGDRSRRAVGRRDFLGVIAAGAAGLLVGRLPAARAQAGEPEATFAELCAALPPGHWTQASLNTFKSVWPPAPYAVPTKQGTPKSVIRAWSASALDHVRGDWYFWGGGHANYNGNEMYRWRTATRRWERCSLPSHMTDASGGDGIFEATIGGVYTAPVASHCYDTMNYLPGLDRVFVGGGAMYGRSGIWRRPYPSTDKTGPYLWDVTKCDALAAGGVDASNWDSGGLGVNPGLEAWENRDTFQDRAGRPLGAPNGYSASAVEDGRDVVYIGWGAGKGLSGWVCRYEFGATAVDDRISFVGRPGSTAWPNQGAAAWDPTRQHFVVFRGNVTGTDVSALLYDISQAAPGNPARAVTINVQDPEGYFSARNWRRMGIQYDAARDLYWLWEGEQDVYALTPGTGDGQAGWVVTRLLDSGSALFPRVYAEIGSVWKGALGKWVHDPVHDVYMGVYHYLTGDVWVYKPPS